MFQMVELLLVFQLLQSSDDQLYWDCRIGLVCPIATVFIQEPQCLIPTAHLFLLGFATGGASVIGVQAYVNLLHHFPEGGFIKGPIFTHTAAD